MAFAAEAMSRAPVSQQPPVLTVIVPVFNAAATIDELLRRVLAAPPRDKQVIVVDDGSTDATPRALDAWERQGQVEVLRHARNRGKGAAVRTGLEQARGRFSIIQDADLEYDPTDYSSLLEPLLAGEAEVVYGSRYMRGRKASDRFRMFRYAGAALNLLAGLLYGQRLTDVFTCYKAFATPRLRAMKLESQRFEFCLEATAKTCRMGLVIKEVPIQYHPRTFREGKKIRWHDGVEAIRTLWKWRRWCGE